MGKRPLEDRLAIYSIIIFCILAVLTVGAFVQAKQTTQPKEFNIGIDYRVLYTAGKSALAGNASQIYDTPSQNEMIQQNMGLKIPDEMHWFYPPTLLLAIVSLLSALPFDASYFIWLTITLALAVLGCRAMLPKKSNLSLLVLSFPAVIHNLRWGQNGFLSTALLAAGIGLMETNPVLSGLMFGLLTYKTWLAVFPLLILLLTRKWKVFGWSAFFTVMTALLSLAAYGAETWQAFFDQLSHVGTTVFTSIWETSAAIQPTLMTALRLFGVNGVPLYVMLALVGVATAAVVVKIFRLTDRLALRGSAMVLGIFAVIPYFIEYDLMLLCIPAILLIYDCMQEGCGIKDYLAIGLLCLMPLYNLQLVKATRVQICPFVAIALLVYVFLRARKSTIQAQDFQRLRLDPIASVPTAGESGEQA